MLLPIRLLYVRAPEAIRGDDAAVSRKAAELMQQWTSSDRASPAWTSDDVLR